MRSVLAALRRPQTYVGTAREAVSVARCVVNYPLGLVDAALSTGCPAGDPVFDTPVVLVHGYGHNRSGWFMLDRRLRRCGFTSVHTVNYVPFLTGVPDLARRLSARIEQVRAMTGADKVHVVGHSLGGVVLRWYVQELGGDRRVDTAITVASPHAGTIAAVAGIGAGAELQPWSPVIRRLADGARPTDVRWIAYYSNIDLLVHPASSAMLTHPDLAATNVFVKDHGHISMMLSPEVGRSIVYQLRAAEGLPGTASISPLHPAGAGRLPAAPAAELG